MDTYKITITGDDDRVGTIALTDEEFKVFEKIISKLEPCGVYAPGIIIENLSAQKRAAEEDKKRKKEEEERKKKEEERKRKRSTRKKYRTSGKLPLWRLAGSFNKLPTAERKLRHFS